MLATISYQHHRPSSPSIDSPTFSYIHTLPCFETNYVQQRPPTPRVSRSNSGKWQDPPMSPSRYLNSESTSNRDANLTVKPTRPSWRLLTSEEVGKLTATEPSGIGEERRGSTKSLLASATSAAGSSSLNSSKSEEQIQGVEDHPSSVAPLGNRSESSRTLCVRHQSMADQGINGKLQQSLDALPLSERAAITSLWSTFSSSPHPKRKIILEGILTMCCFSQLSHLSESLSQIIRVDPFSLFPEEVSLTVLGYLDAISLGKAAQVSRGWKVLADDDLLWRRMCGQHIERKCVRCGWGLPLLERRRLRMEERGERVGIREEERALREHEERFHSGFKRGAEGVEEAEMAGKRRKVGGIEGDGMGEQLLRRCSVVQQSNTVGPAQSSTSTPIESTISTTSALTVNKPAQTPVKGAKRMPWKHVYCERLVVERNWRKGKPIVRSFKGHENAVMCLQAHHNLHKPSYPVLITGSYDKTVKVWNLDTGEVIRTMKGHTRVVRALQFDQVMLVTGSSDRTLRIWNWRTGECLRVLEGHEDGVICLNYDRNTLASGSADHTIKIWNMAVGSCFVLRGHSDMINSVLLWDGKTSPSERAFNAITEPPTRTTNSPDSEVKFLFSASDDGTIKLWDLRTRSCLRTFYGHKGQVQSIRLLVVDKEVDDKERHSDQAANQQVASSISPSNSNTPPHSASGPIFCSTPFAPFQQQQNAATSSANNAQTRRATRSETAHAGVATSFLPEDKCAILVSGALDNTVKVWDVATGNVQNTLFGHIEGVWSVDVDSLRIASASHDRTIKIWDRESGRNVHTLSGHRGGEPPLATLAIDLLADRISRTAVTSLQLSDDMIISGSDDGEVRVWSFAPSPVTTTTTTALVLPQTPSKATGL